MAFCGAPRWYQSVAQGALVHEQCMMEWVRAIVHDVPQLRSILLSETVTESGSTPRTEPAFLMSFLILLMSNCSHPAAPAHDSIENCTQHSAADIERLEPPEEVELALVPLVHSIDVLGPVQLPVQVNSQVLIVLNQLHIHPLDGNRCRGDFCLLKFTTNSFVLLVL